MSSRDIHFPVGNEEGEERIKGQHLPLKNMLDLDVRRQIKWKLNAAFNLMGRKPPIRCPCNPENPIRVN
jgi:hypothetical protein